MCASEALESFSKSWRIGMLLCGLLDLSLSLAVYLNGSAGISEFKFALGALIGFRVDLFAVELGLTCLILAFAR